MKIYRVFIRSGNRIKTRTYSVLSLVWIYIWPKLHFPENLFSWIYTCQILHLAEVTFPQNYFFKNCIFYPEIYFQKTIFHSKNYAVFLLLNEKYNLTFQWFPTFFQPWPIFILKIYHGPTLKVLLNCNFASFCDLLAISQRKRSSKKG